MRNRSALPVAIATAAAAALLLSGCVNNSTASPGSSTGASSGVGNVAKDDAAAALLPASVKSAGKLIIGTDPTYAPNEYKDNAGNPIGWEIDLAGVMAAKLGVKTEYQVSKFDNIIPSVTGSKADLGLSSFTDTTEREQQVDFVNYYSAGIQWASPKGKTVDPDNACGLKVAVQSTTYEDTDEVPAKSKACTDAGKPAIQKLQFDTQDAATNAVVLGQADALSADSPVTLYAIAQTKDKLQTAGKTFDVAPYGIVVKKDSKLVQAVQKALQSMVDDGSYKKVLDKWGVADGGVSRIDLNAASKG